MYKRKVLAITFFGRSGSVFFQSLLDNHPNCITIPGCYIMSFQEWFDNLKEKKNEYVINKFCNDFQVLFDPTYINENPRYGLQGDVGLAHNFHKVGDKKNEKILVDKKKFILFLRNELKYKRNIEIEELFEAIHVAYAHSLGIKLKKEDWIVFQLHSPVLSRASFLKNFNTKIISVIREPVQTSLSVIKHFQQYKDFKNKNLLPTFIHSLINARPLSGFEDVTRSIRLEDLHMKSKETMKLVLDWMGLSWHDNVLFSTFQGKLWHNLAGADKVQGFNKVIINKKHNDLINDYDRAFFVFYFQNLYKVWGYSYSSKSMLGFFTPFKMEKNNSFFEIIYNRVLLIKYYVKNLNLLRILFKKPYKVVNLLK